MNKFTNLLLLCICLQETIHASTVIYFENTNEPYESFSVVLDQDDFNISGILVIPDPQDACRYFSYSRSAECC